MSFFDIFIRSKSDTSGIKTAQGAVDGLNRKLQEAGVAGTGFGRIVSGLGTVLRSPLALIGMGVAGITAGLRLATKALREFAESELADAKVTAALKSMGQYTESFRAKITALADEYQRTTLIADETWKEQFTTLIRFGATSDNIDQVAGAVKNLAGMLGGDLHQATMLIARAMQGSYEAFGRYGLQVEDAGTQTEKLNKLFELLAQRGAGAFEAKLGTLSGKTAALKNSWGTDWGQRGFGRIRWEDFDEQFMGAVVPVAADGRPLGLAG